MDNVEQAIRIDERLKCLEEINARIVHGHLPGNGTDKQAERNGIVWAYNLVYLGLKRVESLEQE